MEILGLTRRTEAHLRVHSRFEWAAGRASEPTGVLGVSWEAHLIFTFSCCFCSIEVLSSRVSGPQGLRGAPCSPWALSLLLPWSPLVFCLPGIPKNSVLILLSCWKCC